MTSWCSKKQSCVAQSIAEAEYVAACMAAKEAMWLHKLLSGLFDEMVEPTMIMRDNQSCVKFSVNPVLHNKFKHVEIKYHYLRDMVQRETIELKYVSTEEQVVDFLTKPLSRMKFNYF